MIKANGDLFSIELKNSIYAMKVEDGRLRNIYWGPKPKGFENESFENGLFHASKEHPFLYQIDRDELITYGDCSNHRVSLKATYPQQDDIDIRDCRLVYDSHEIVTDAEPGYAPTHGVPTRSTTPRETLIVHMKDPEYSLRAALYYRVTPETDIIERWVEYSNAGDEDILFENCGSATVHLPTGTFELTSVNGAWAREFTTTRETVQVGCRVIEQHVIDTGHGSNPFFLMNRPNQAWEETGNVYFGALAYSGSWQIEVERLTVDEVRLHTGYNTFDFDLTLKGGESHKTPAMVIGFSDEGWGGASRRMHAFTINNVQPCPVNRKFTRPVLYNSWEATYFDLNFENQTKLADIAAKIGVELYCVDDGWFGDRRDAHAGLGDWTVSKDVFPDGLEPLAKHIKNLGMKFGLWVEPEMVNKNSNLYREHPDWILQFKKRPNRENRNQLILDFGREEVVENIYNQLDELVSKYEIDFFKWDMNRHTSEPGSVAEKEIWFKHTAGVYSIMDRLRKKYPNLDIQSCSGGGGRVDLGVLGRTEQVWTSDNTDALDRISIQEGYSLMYPARAMESWVTSDKNHQTGRELPLSLRFDVAMRGNLGIGENLSILDEETLELYAEYITFYKSIKDVVQLGDLYRLQRVEEAGASIVQYVTQDGKEAVYSYAGGHARLGVYVPETPLMGLNSSSVYDVKNHKGETIYETTGFDLMTRGIPFTDEEHFGGKLNRVKSFTLHIIEK